MLAISPMNTTFLRTQFELLNINTAVFMPSVGDVAWFKRAAVQELKELYQ